MIFAIRCTVKDIAYITDIMDITGTKDTVRIHSKINITEITDITVHTFLPAASGTKASGSSALMPHFLFPLLHLLGHVPVHTQYRNICLVAYKTNVLTESLH
jgi:hypothetical protein